MLGLSSSYYGFLGKGVFDSVKSVFDLGFEAVELGAGHCPEKGIWETVKRIKHDFPDKSYTLHGLFPPPKERAWFNASVGLTKQNREIVDSFFRAAGIVEAKVVSIHPGFREEIKWQEHSEPMSHPLSQKPIAAKKAWSNLFAVIERCLALAREIGCVFAIENVPDVAIPLVYSLQDFKKVLEKFPELTLLLDVGHALYDGMLEGFLDEFSDRVGQVHLHFSRPAGVAPKIDEHTPVKSAGQLKPLCSVKQFKRIPVIFEHWPKTSEAEISFEKKIVEEFEANFE